VVLVVSDAVESVNGPVVWNSLPNDLPSIDISLSTFRKRLKAFLFDTDTRHSAFAACTNLRFVSDIIIIIIIIINNYYYS